MLAEFTQGLCLCYLNAAAFVLNERLLVRRLMAMAFYISYPRSVPAAEGL
jgi:hypothetical protein